jgi:cytochrome c oxidase assembly factor CtaG
VGTAWAHAPGTATDLGAAASLRAEIIVPLAMLAALYALGWSRLARRAPHPLGLRRPLMALVGLAALGVALLSPLDRLAETLFVAHMTQHMLLIMVAAPAVLLADPFAAVVWALPRPARPLGRLVGRTTFAGRLWRTATAMSVAWIAFACVLWTWHWPAVYEAALARRALHDLEHLCFFVGAVLFWWPVIHPAPRLRRGAAYPARVVYLVLGAFQTAALGLWLTLAPAPLYRSYGLDDQAWGGIVMWGLGGLIDMLAVLVLVHRTLGPPLPRDSTHGHVSAV